MAISQQRPSVVPFIVESVRFVAVIDGHDEASANRASRIFDPAACVQARLRLLTFRKRNFLLAEILLDRKRVWLEKHFDELAAFKSHVYFAQLAAIDHNAVRGQSIQQFVRENASIGNLFWDFRAA